MVAMQVHPQPDIADLCSDGKASVKSSTQQRSLTCSVVYKFIYDGLRSIPLYYIIWIVIFDVGYVMAMVGYDDAMDKTSFDLERVTTFYHTLLNTTHISVLLAMAMAIFSTGWIGEPFYSVLKAAEEGQTAKEYGCCVGCCLRFSWRFGASLAYVGYTIILLCIFFLVVLIMVAGVVLTLVFILAAICDSEGHIRNYCPSLYRLDHAKDDDDFLHYSLVDDVCVCNGTVTRAGSCTANGGWQTTGEMLQFCAYHDDIKHSVERLAIGLLICTWSACVIFGNYNSNASRIQTYIKFARGAMPHDREGQGNDGTPHQANDLPSPPHVY